MVTWRRSNVFDWILFGQNDVIADVDNNSQSVILSRIDVRLPFYLNDIGIPIAQNGVAVLILAKSNVESDTC
jgi:hypothetical protein